MWIKNPEGKESNTYSNSLMASPPKNDAWHPYLPHEQRIVFIRRAGALKPYLGMVIEWPLTANGSRFLVAYVDKGVSRSVRIERFDRRRLVPIALDPNDLIRGGR